jgi:hypothetical protein
MARDPGSRLVCFLNFEARLQPYITEDTGQTVLANATRCPASPAIVLLVNRQRARAFAFAVRCRAEAEGGRIRFKETRLPALGRLPPGFC